jgi:hypothetical protein
MIKLLHPADHQLPFNSEKKGDGCSIFLKSNREGKGERDVQKIIRF